MTNIIEDILNNIQKILIISVVGFIFLHICFFILRYGFDHDYVYGLSSLFDLSTERNFPTWFATLNLFNSCLLLFIIYKITNVKNPDKFWAFLSFIFLYLSADEMIGLHESVSIPIRNWGGFTDYLFYSWIIAGGLFVLFIFLLSIPFLKRLPPKAALYFFIAGAIFVLGAIGMEMPGANVAYYYAQLDQGVGLHETSILYDIITTIEETLELCGIMFFNYALIRYVKYIVNDKETY